MPVLLRLADNIDLRIAISHKVEEASMNLTEDGLAVNETFRSQYMIVVRDSGRNISVTN